MGIGQGAAPIEGELDRPRSRGDRDDALNPPAAMPDDWHMNRHHEEGSEMSDITRLVLSRKVLESINIGGLITVTVEEIRGRTVRIAVQAPRGIAVHRQEIYERIVGGGQEESGDAGDRVPAGSGSGPRRPAARALTVAEAAPGRRRAVGPAAVAAGLMADGAETRRAIGRPPGVGGDDPI
jgi:carbon storage regulator